MKILITLFFFHFFGSLFSMTTIEDAYFERCELLDKRGEEFQRELSWYLNKIKVDVSPHPETLSEEERLINELCQEKWVSEYQYKVEAVYQVQKAFISFQNAFWSLFVLQAERIHGGFCAVNATLDAQNWYQSYLEEHLFYSGWKPDYIAACKEESLLHAVFTDNWEALCGHLEKEPQDKNVLLLEGTRYGTESEACIRLLLEEGADPNSIDHKGNTPLHYAVEHKKGGVVKTLLEKGADVNAINHEGQTPLFAAFSDIAVVQLLLDAGASTEIVDAEGRTAFSYAGDRWGDKDVLELLFDRGAPFDPKWVFLHAAKEGCFKIVENILAGEFDIDFQNEWGETALLGAIYWSKYNGNEVARFLIRKGANCSLVTHGGRSPLIEAIENRNQELLVLLTEQEIDLNGEQSRVTPLFTAIKEGWKEGIMHLLEKGADVNAKNQEDGEKPLHAAASHGCVRLVQALVGKGAEVDLKAFYYAAKGRHKEILRYFVEQGVLD